MYYEPNDTFLMHYGIKGMKWGVRRFQKKDGTLTNAGKKRYDEDDTASNQNSKKKMSTAKKVAIGAVATAVIVGGTYGAYKYSRARNDAKLVRDTFGDLLKYTKDTRKVETLKWDDLKDLNINQLQSDSDRARKLYSEGLTKLYTQRKKTMLSDGIVRRKYNRYKNNEIDRKMDLLKKNTGSITNKIHNLSNEYYIKEPASVTLDRMKNRK